mmetsp:Transcript_43506/g.68897  ORF Transcript_43506/g.68897 Transcript_43506/m.68897 type:complete len:209 (+) Transcript_43506:95-721(+)
MGLRICCGCLSLQSAVQAILICHLANNVFCCVLSFASVVLELPRWGYATSAMMQVATFAWSLAGIPIILLALYGVCSKVVGLVRFYFWYLVVSFIVDFVFLYRIWLIQDSCAHLDSARIGHGRAFACSVARLTSFASVALLTAFLVYVIYLVWLYCKDRVSGGSAAMIEDLMAGAEIMDKKRLARYAAKSKLGQEAAAYETFNSSRNL